MILDIKGKQDLNCLYVCFFNKCFCMYMFVCFFLYVFELSRSSSNDCLAILHRTVTQICWLSLLQIKTAGYIVHRE